MYCLVRCPDQGLNNVSFGVATTVPFIEVSFFQSVVIEGFCRILKSKVLAREMYMYSIEAKVAAFEEAKLP